MYGKRKAFDLASLIILSLFLNADTKRYANVADKVCKNLYNNFLPSYFIDQAVIIVNNTRIPNVSR